MKTRPRSIASSLSWMRLPGKTCFSSRSRADRALNASLGTTERITAGAATDRDGLAITASSVGFTAGPVAGADRLEDNGDPAAGGWSLARVTGSVVVPAELFRDTIGVRATCVRA